MSVVPGRPDDIVISLEYEPGGLGWADMWDNTVIGWRVSDSAGAPEPVVVGSLPASVIGMPQWIIVEGQRAIVPDKWRGSVFDLFEFLATNNLAADAPPRQLRGNFTTHNVTNAWNVWAERNPTLVWPGLPPPPEADEAEAGSARQRR